VTPGKQLSAGIRQGLAGYIKLAKSHSALDSLPHSPILKKAIWLLVCSFVLTATSCSTAAPSPSPDYEHEIKPILRQRCYACHSRLKQKAELRLDAGALVHKGGKHGPVVASGKS